MLPDLETETRNDALVNLMIITKTKFVKIQKAPYVTNITGTL